MKLRAFLFSLLLTIPAYADPPATTFTDQDKLAPLAPAAPSPYTTGPSSDAFAYVKPQPKHYFRGALEVATILIVGNVDYLLNTSARGGTTRPGDRRWDLRYDWPTFRTKLTGEDWKLDGNQFNTNYISHPFAGTLYYTAARANRLSVFESFAYTTVGALSWEMFGELREEVSINDVVVTSTSGLTLGEPLIELSSFFYRSKKSLGYDGLAAVFSPMKALNDGADGADHARSRHVDALGLTLDEWHRFEAFAGGGQVIQPSKTGGAVRAGLDLRLVNLPGYVKPARRRDVYDDGNVSGLRFETTFAGNDLLDAALTSEVSPAGVYVGTDRDGMLFGWLASFEYSTHDYDRDRRRPRDVVAALRPAGVFAEYNSWGTHLHAKTRLSISSMFAGVTAYGLSDYRARGYGDMNLQSVLSAHGYYHSLGATLSPSFLLEGRFFDVGGQAAVDTWRSLGGLDTEQAKITQEIPMSDRRARLSGWAALKLPDTPARCELLFSHRIRQGSVGSVVATQRETSWFVTMGAMF